MKYYFKGVFTDAEKGLIRRSLEALDEVARALGMDSMGDWHIDQRRREGGKAGEIELRALSTEGTEFWGDSASDLVSAIDKTAAFLSQRRKT